MTRHDQRSILLRLVPRDKQPKGLGMWLIRTSSAGRMNSCAIKLLGLVSDLALAGVLIGGAFN
jgi:hypothetical protein